MIYTAARQKKQKTAGAIVPAVIFYARVPHPKANRRTTKQEKQEQCIKKHTGTANNLAINYLL